MTGDQWLSEFVRDYGAERAARELKGLADELQALAKRGGLADGLGVLPFFDCSELPMFDVAELVPLRNAQVRNMIPPVWCQSSEGISNAACGSNVDPSEQRCRLPSSTGRRGCRAESKQ